MRTLQLESDVIIYLNFIKKNQIIEREVDIG